MKFNQDPRSVWFKPLAAEIDYNTEDDYYYYDTTDKSDGSTYQINRSISPNISDPRHVFLYYSTTDETTMTSELMIDLPTFISAVGGNLGLFLGFSFMGVVFSFYNMIKSHIHWKGRDLDRKRLQCLDKKF